MSDTRPPGQLNLARQVRQHLESLRSAGVEWLPKPAAAAPTASDPGTSDVPSGSEIGAPSAASLFDSQDDRMTLSLEQRQQALGNLCGRVAQCNRCADLAAARRHTVFGVGRLSPEICFVGEAPGAEEDAQGEPFVGAAGQLLNKIIAACGMKREEVYICNIIKCRPPGNRLPLPTEAANCREYLEDQIELIKPRFICALGACAAQNLLNTTTAIGRLRGQFHQYRGIPVLCTYHPAYLLRSPDKKRDVWEDMKRLLARMGKPLPEVRS
jgi:uracil-DNA glycosylase